MNEQPAGNPPAPGREAEDAGGGSRLPQVAVVGFPNAGQVDARQPPRGRAGGGRPLRARGDPRPQVARGRVERRPLRARRHRRRRPRRGRLALARGPGPGARGDGGRRRDPLRRRRALGARTRATPSWRPSCAGRRPVLVVANKVDNPADEPLAAELHALGLGEPHPRLRHPRPRHRRPARPDRRRIARESSRTRPGSDDACGVAVDRPPERRQVLARQPLPRRRAGDRLRGRPGRPATRSTPGSSSRAAQIVLVDTAGLRRRSRLGGSVDYYSQLRTERAAERADVAIVVCDASEGLVADDLRAAELAMRSGCATIVALNKWDARRPGDRPRGRPRPAREAPAPAPPGRRRLGEDRAQRRRPCLREAIRLADRRAERIPTPELNRFVGDVVADRPPPSRNGRRLRLLYAAQVGTAPPRFAVQVNDRRLVSRDWAYFFENRMRAALRAGGRPAGDRLRAAQAPRALAQPRHRYKRRRGKAAQAQASRPAGRIRERFASRRAASARRLPRASRNLLRRRATPAPSPPPAGSHGFATRRAASAGSSDGRAATRSEARVAAVGSALAAVGPRFRRPLVPVLPPDPAAHRRSGRRSLALARPDLVRGGPEPALPVPRRGRVPARGRRRRDRPRRRARLCPRERRSRDRAVRGGGRGRGAAPDPHRQLLRLRPGPVRGSARLRERVRPWLGGEIAVAIVPGEGRQPRAGPAVRGRRHRRRRGLRRGDWRRDRSRRAITRGWRCAPTSAATGERDRLGGFLVIGERGGRRADDRRRARRRPRARRLAARRAGPRRAPRRRVAEVAVSEDRGQRAPRRAAAARSARSRRSSTSTPPSAPAPPLVADEGALELAVHSELDPERLDSSPGFFEAFPAFEPSLTDDLGPATLAYLGPRRPGRERRGPVHAGDRRGPRGRHRVRRARSRTSSEAASSTSSPSSCPLLEGEAAFAIEPAGSGAGEESPAEAEEEVPGEDIGAPDAPGEVPPEELLPPEGAPPAPGVVPPTGVPYLLLRRRRGRRGGSPGDAGEAPGPAGRGARPGRVAAGAGLLGARDRGRRGPQPAPLADGRPHLRRLRRNARRRHRSPGGRRG